MLDLTGIPVVDNHCHPVLLNQHMDGVQFRGYCTEATDAIFAEEHIPNTVYYLSKRPSWKYATNLLRML